ncbi:Ribokinase-like protein [Auriscalpium vulgare]|uniref:Ribokinase-like protein n=1 Tax=Auriscalpium vulgare TaxID=40419 RepID=A0ACB8S0J1_9AGAM|nr:Ribokinase-like protein [Auriscalpium vulgare]
MPASTFPLLCLGHPLLDIQVTHGEVLLEKYGLKANDAILAQDKHAPLRRSYDEVVRDYEVSYLAGGGAQTAARGAAYILPPESVVFIGCVGDDELAAHLRAANHREGLREAYYVKKGERTGVCAVIITGTHRSLVTTLRAAQSFDIAHLHTPEISRLIDGARVFYVEGYFLRHAVDSVVEVGKKASESGKIFVTNLSAPYVAQFFKAELEEVLFYTDIIIGNEAEAAAWAVAAALPDTGPDDFPAIARALALLPKFEPARPRTVVLTQGPEATILVSAAAPDSPRVFPVERLPDAQIVDTNGAGDAFAGGFLGALVAGKPIDECVRVGQRLGAMSVQMEGPQYRWPREKVM